MIIFDINNSIFTSDNANFWYHECDCYYKKAILDIWNNIDIRNTFSNRHALRQVETSLMFSSLSGIQLEIISEYPFIYYSYFAFYSN